MTTTPESVPGYADLVEVARGGDSIVYRARDLATGRAVALKVVLVDSPESRARFAREVEITVTLGSEHPHIVTVLDTATTESGRPCLVMDFADAGSLDDWLLAEGPLPVPEVVRIGRQLAEALAFAHERGVVHGDVKPQNVLVLSGGSGAPRGYVLTDFGIARFADSTHPDTERFSYRHASPQVLDGLSPQPSDDIWSLGSTLHTLLDGRPPFASDDPGDDTALAYLRRARSGSPRPLHPAVPEELRQIVQTCLAKRRSDRYAAAADITARLAHAGAATESTAHRPPSGARAARLRWRRAVALVVAGLGIGSLVGWWGWARLDPGSDHRAPAALAPPTPARASASTVPTVTGAAGSHPPDAAAAAAELRSTITVAEIRDTAVYLEWSDPSHGQAAAVVVEHPPGAAARPVVALSPGVLSHTLQLTGPGPHCFTIVLWLGQSWGTSPQRCVGVSGP